MDHFTKQSLRAVHEHVTTMSYQLHECRSVTKDLFSSTLKMQRVPSKSDSFCFGRIKQMEKFHFALLEELENFEKDSQSLKNLEKEFLVCILVAWSQRKLNSYGIHHL